MSKTKLNDMTRAEWLKTAKPGDIERWVDQGFRHKQGPQEELRTQVIAHWQEVGRALSNMVTPDPPGAFSEFEKHLSIMVKRLVLAERALKVLAGDEDWHEFRDRVAGVG